MKRLISAIFVLGVGCGGGGGEVAGGGTATLNAVGSGPSGPHGLTGLFFLHHSVGDGLVVAGDMRGAVAVYNAEHSTGYVFWDHGYNSDGLRNASGAFTGTSYNLPDDNTNTDGLAMLWTSSAPGWANARSQILANHQVIAFKSCFTVLPGLDAPTLAQWQSEYVAMRNFFDTRPDRLFIVMSPPPLHRTETNPDEANFARQFANWLSGTYVAGHPNVRCFDLFDRLARSDDGSPMANMLRLEYEWPGVVDSHPNATANQTVGPALARFMMVAAAGY